MQSFTSPDHDQTAQNRLHLCGTVEVQAFQLLVPRDFLHRRQEVFSIEMMKKHSMHSFKRNFWAHGESSKEWNSPRCSQIDWKPKRVVSVNSATNSITRFQKNNLKCIRATEMHHKRIFSFLSNKYDCITNTQT